LRGYSRIKSHTVQAIVREPKSTSSIVNPITAFGLFAVSAMMIFYVLEPRSHWFVLAFAGSCMLASVYGFLQGAWPFGVVEAVWALVALRKWRQARTGSASTPPIE
jgi:hypothetical protein